MESGKAEKKEEEKKSGTEGEEESLRHKVKMERGGGLQEWRFRVFCFNSLGGWNMRQGKWKSNAWWMAGRGNHEC